MVTIRQIFALNLRLLRGERTQKAMAALLEMEDKTYQRLERGDNFPKEETLNHLCKKLGVSEVSLFQAHEGSPLISELLLILPALNEAQLHNLLSTAKLFRDVNTLAFSKINHLSKDKG